MKWRGMLFGFFTFLIGCAGVSGSELLDIEDIADLKKHFNEDIGKVRLILLVSPT